MPLYNEFDQWNRAAHIQRNTFYEVRDAAEDWLFRTLIHDLKPHCFVLMAFIFDRTFRWSKYAEAISHDHFLHGLQEIDGSGNAQPRMNTYREPLCKGLSEAFRNSKATLTKHLKEIENLELVTKLSAKRRTGRSVKSYMFNREILSYWIVAANGSLPEGAPLIKGAPALLDDSPVRITEIRRATVAADDEGPVEHLEYVVQNVNGEHFLVTQEELTMIRLEDWDDIKKSNRRL